MDNNDTIIRLSNVFKKYNIFKRPQDRFYNSVCNILSSNKNNKHRYYKEFIALNNIDLKIKRGETIGIVGRNGSGKSTLLQVISNVLTATSGKVEVFGKISALLELGAGFNPEYSGRENIITYGTILGLSQAEIKYKIDKIIEFSELKQFIEQPIKTYSSGMYVRLAFAIAIHTNPEILIIDEALAVGDEAFQRKCFAEIRSFQDSGGTIIFVSHNSSLIMDLCTRAVLLEKGKLLMLGSPKKVITCYQKLIHSNNDDEDSIIDEILKDSHALESKENKINNQTINTLTEKYDDTLTPSSTIYYKSNGVLIEDAKITTTDNKIVNILLPQKEYIFSYQAYFKDKANDIRLGMLIKTITGLELGGATNSSFNEPIKTIQPDTTIIVSFKFKCLLNSGTYFLNAGVTTTENGNEGFLARTIDILMFKVQETQGCLATGIIDFLVSTNIKTENF